MITYKNVLNSNSEIKMVRVFSDGRFSGTIESVSLLGDKKGWRYFADGLRRHPGEILPSIEAVKKTLEGE